MGIIRKFIRFLENHLAADISPSRADYAANDDGPERGAVETPNESKKAKNGATKRLRARIDRVEASIKRHPARWAIFGLMVALCLNTCYTSYKLHQIQETMLELRKIGIETGYFKAYSYKVVTPADDKFTTFMNNQGALGWRIVHARRATKKAADGWTTIPIYEVILERGRIFR